MFVLTFLQNVVAEFAELERLTEDQNVRELLYHLKLVLCMCSKGSMHVFASLMLTPQNLQVRIVIVNSKYALFERP